MKYLLSVFLIGLFSFAPEADSVKKFHWLVGNWKDESKEIYEIWQPVNDSTLSGFSYHIDEDGERIVDEFLRIVGRTDGYYYIPTVSLQNLGKEVEFKIVSSTPTSFVAENSKHDFPQRIGYELINEKRMDAYIEGLRGDKKERITFQFSR